MCLSIKAIREDQMEALNTIISAENIYELRQVQNLQVFLQLNSREPEQPIESHPLQRVFLLNLLYVATDSLLTTLRWKSPSAMDIWCI